MRGIDTQQGVVFSYLNLEERIPPDHPLRAIRRMMDQSLQALSSHFDTLYAATERDSIPPERLLRALLLQALYSVRRERPLMEQRHYNLLFRGFVGLNPDDPVWDVTVYTKNRERLLAGEVSERLLDSVVEQARAAQLLSEEHFTVDGTLIQAWAKRRSFPPQDPAAVVGTGARGKKLLRDQVDSSTDADARLYSKGGSEGSKPSYRGHVLIENRQGLVVGACATRSSKTAEPEAALQMLDRRGRSRPSPGSDEARPEPGGEPQETKPKPKPITLGADTAYPKQEFIEGLRQRNIAPHVAEYVENPNFPNFLTPEERTDWRFGISQSKRKLIEKIFGWGKQDRAVKQIKLRGLMRVDWMFQLVMVAHDLVRMVKLIPAPTPVLVA